MTRKECDEMSAALNRASISAEAYYSDAQDKDAKQWRWMNDETQVCSGKRALPIVYVNASIINVFSFTLLLVYLISLCR